MVATTVHKPPSLAPSVSAGILDYFIRFSMPSPRTCRPLPRDIRWDCRVIASLREHGRFVADQLETILIIPPKDSIKAKALLLVGLGEEEALSLNLLEAVGRVALREAGRLGVRKVAFAPLIRDQGNSKFP